MKNAVILEITDMTCETVQLSVTVERILRQRSVDCHYDVAEAFTSLNAMKRSASSMKESIFKVSIQRG